LSGPGLMVMRIQILVATKTAIAGIFEKEASGRNNKLYDNIARSCEIIFCLLSLRLWSGGIYRVSFLETIILHVQPV